MNMLDTRWSLLTVKANTSKSNVSHFTPKHATDLSEYKEKNLTLWEASHIINTYVQEALLGLQRQQLYHGRSGFMHLKKKKKISVTGPAPG